MRTILKKLSLMLLAVVMLGGCASLGNNPADKRAAVLEMRNEALTTLYREQPGSRQEVDDAAGYGVFDEASQNLIFLQTGGGYGVLTGSNGEKTFMKVGGAGVGFGLGLKEYREIIIFRNHADYVRFRDHGWEASGQAEATAQGGDKGGSASAKQTGDLDVKTYRVMGSGVALQATVGASKYWQWNELNR